MAWYWILLITFGSVILYSLIMFPLWALMRASSLQSRWEENCLAAKANEERLDSRKENKEN